MSQPCAFSSPFSGILSAMGILHQVQGEHFIARLAAMIFLLQIARAQGKKIESSPDGSVSGDTPD